MIAKDGWLIFTDHFMAVRVSEISEIAAKQGGGTVITLRSGYDRLSSTHTIDEDPLEVFYKVSGLVLE